MTIKAFLMPIISSRLLSQERLLKRRAKAEARRLRQGTPHRVDWFHQVDDPYSALAAQILPAFVDRYAIELVPHLVPPPADSAAPDRARLIDWSRRDAQLLAGRLGLAFRDPGQQPPDEAVSLASERLLASIASGQFVDQVAKVSAQLWAMTMGDGPRASDAVRTHLAASSALRASLGHYLGAMFHYAGEWYWGLDRLHHLEQRLQALGLDRRGGPMLVAPPVDRQRPIALSQPPEIEFFFSLRSPYSAIAAPRVFRLAQLTGASVRLRYLLPMVMRGLPVPASKRRYISEDAAREARLHGIAFGRVNDPVGRPTERGLAVLALAERQGLGQQYVLSFMQGVWAEGLDAGGDRGLRIIAQRAGLDWAQSKDALRDTAWRDQAEANRAALLQAGLWGVPSFRVRNLTVWGQDRLWAVEQALTSEGAIDMKEAG